MTQFTISTYDKDFNITSIFGENFIANKSKTATLGKKVSIKKELDQEISL